MAYTQGITAGTQFAFAGLVQEQYNRLIDTNGALPAAGQAGSMLRLLGIQVANTGFPENESVTVPGDDTTQGSIEFDADTPNEFILEFGVFNLDDEATLQGTNVVQFGDVRLGARRPVNATYPDACLIIQSKAKQKDIASGGAKGWTGLIYPRVSLQPLGEASRTGRTATSFRMKATAQPSTHTPWGFTITEDSDNFGTPGLYAMPFTLAYPIYMQPLTLAGGGGENFVLDYTPASSSVNSNILVVNSTKYSSGYTITPATKTLSISTSFTAGDYGFIMYGIKI